MSIRTKVFDSGIGELQAFKFREAVPKDFRDSISRQFRKVGSPPAFGASSSSRSVVPTPERRY